MSFEPQVQYAKTSDGVNIAYYAIGEGTPVVFAADPPCSHMGLEWQQPLFREAFEGYLSHHTLVRYDARGLGMSDRDPVDFSLAARVSDLEAVADAARLDQFILIALNNSGPVAIRYAVQHRQRLTHLVLWNTVVDGRQQFRPTPQLQAMTQLLETDWEMFTENMVGVAFGWGREDVRRYGEFLRQCVDRPTFLRLYTALAQVNVSNDLPAIAVPTLVMHQSGITPVAEGRSVAAAIPGARLVVVEGKWGENIEEYMRAVATFLGDDEPLPVADFVRDGSLAAPTVAPAVERRAGVRTVLFTDLVGHTEMMRRLGDARGREVLREHERITRGAINQHGGTEIKTDGDSFMVSFGSVASAMECAVALQQEFAQRNESSDEPLRVRMGLNAGEPIDDHGDLFGEAVILASRIAAQAGEGEVLIAEPVRHLLAGKGFVFADRGEFVPKGFEDAVRLFEVRWQP